MRREYEKLLHELEDEISKEKMEEVEIILSDHEDIVRWKLEIETLLSKCVNITFPPKNGIEIISFSASGKTITGTTNIENQQAQIQTLPKQY